MKYFALTLLFVKLSLGFKLYAQNCLETISPIDSFSMGFPFILPNKIAFSNGYIMIPPIDSSKKAFIVYLKTKEAIPIEYGRIRRTKITSLELKTLKIEKKIITYNSAEVMDMLITGTQCYFIVSDTVSTIYQLDLNTHELKTINTNCKDVYYLSINKIKDKIYFLGTDYQQKLYKIDADKPNRCLSYHFKELLMNERILFCHPLGDISKKMIDEDILVINHPGYSVNYLYSFKNEAIVGLFSNPNIQNIGNAEFLFSPKTLRCGMIEQDKKALLSTSYFKVNQFNFNNQDYIYQIALLPCQLNNDHKSYKDFVLSLNTNSVITVWNNQMNLITNLLLSKGTHFLGFHNDKFYSFDYLNDQEIKIYEYNTHQLLSSH